MRNGKDTATWILPRRAGEGDRVAVEGARGAPCPLRLARSVLATSPASQGRSLKTYLPQRLSFTSLNAGRSENGERGEAFSGWGEKQITPIISPKPPTRRNRASVRLRRVDTLALSPPRTGGGEQAVLQHPLFATRHSLFAIYPGGTQQ